MEKRREFSRDTIEVCRNCRSEGEVWGDEDIYCNIQRVTCPVCGGSGLVRKRIEGTVTVEPYKRKRP